MYTAGSGGIEDGKQSEVAAGEKAAGQTNGPIRAADETTFVSNLPRYLNPLNFFNAGNTHTYTHLPQTWCFKPSAISLAGSKSSTS